MPDATRRPVVGLTGHRQQARFGFWDREIDLISASFVDAVIAAGADVLVIPSRPDLGDGALDRVDGLVLSGGPDVDPGWYGQAPHPKTEQSVRDRDTAEFRFLLAAAARGLPVLAVCRGMQVLNVARGGTLEQHIPDRDEHPDHGASGTFAHMSIRVRPQSWLASVVGQRTVGNCHHHQAVDKLGQGLVPVAWAEDGVIEALESDDGSPVLAVQWHPEETSSDRVLKGFVDLLGRVPSVGVQ